MSAAAEYYGYLLSQGYNEYQLNKFSELANSADKGEISHNKAYREACKAGFSNIDGDNKSFGTWMETAKEAGWIDGGLKLIGGIIEKRRESKQPYMPPPPPPKDNTMVYVVGAIAILGIGVGVYLATKKK